MHAFASDPRRGVFILLLLVVVIGGSLTLYAIRAPNLKGGGLFAPLSREGALVLNNVLLVCGCATVFLGTLYPLFLDAIGGPKLSVGFPFFDRTFAPMMVLLLLAVGVGIDAGVEARRPAGRATATMGGVRGGADRGGRRPRNNARRPRALAVLGIALAAWVMLRRRRRVGRARATVPWRHR